MEAPFPRHYLPRLQAEFYKGDAFIHWNLSLQSRQTGWLTENFHCQFRELLLHTTFRFGLLCPVYSLMPDHKHCMWVGLNKETDQREAMAFFRTHLKKLIFPFKYQHQAYDHVLKDYERKQNAFTTICNYILNNPVRKNLVANARQWKFSGAVLPGYFHLDPRDEGYWEKFWTIYNSRRSPDAANIKKPFIS